MNPEIAGLRSILDRVREALGNPECDDSSLPRMVQEVRAELRLETEQVACEHEWGSRYFRMDHGSNDARMRRRCRKCDAEMVLAQEYSAPASTEAKLEAQLEELREQLAKAEEHAEEHNAKLMEVIRQYAIHHTFCAREIIATGAACVCGLDDLMGKDNWE